MSGGKWHDLRPQVCNPADVRKMSRVESTDDVGVNALMTLPDTVLTRLEARFEKLRPALVREHPNQWALLIYGGSKRVPVLDVWADEWDAICAGYADPQARRFCVKQIIETDEDVFVSSLGAWH